MVGQGFTTFPFPIACWARGDLVIEARDGWLCGLEMKLGTTVRAGDFVGLGVS